MIKKYNKSRDMLLLKNLKKEMVTVTDRQSQRAIYYVPLDERDLDVCKFVFEKYGVKMEKYKSGLYPGPILKITFSGIEKLTDDARNFLFSINHPARLSKDSNKDLIRVMKEMEKAHNK